MGKGLATLTFDKEFQRKRMDQINKKPANLQEGLARSGKGLVMVCVFINKLVQINHFYHIFFLCIRVFSMV